MSSGYRAVQWSPGKRRYDLAVVGVLGLYLAAFVAVTLLHRPEITVETALIRAFGTGALLLQSFSHGTIMATQGDSADSPPWTLILWDATARDVFFSDPASHAAGVLTADDLLAALATAGLAAKHAGAGAATVVLLGLSAVPAAVPALAFARAPSAAAARGVETASGLWTLALYLLLGAIPFTARWLSP